MKKLLIAALCMACFAIPAAQAGQVTLAQLKEQAPQRLQMTVVTDSGETIAVDAPILLPEGDEMPLVLAKRATFNTLGLDNMYPVFGGASVYEVREECDNLTIYQQEKANKLLGKTDESKRVALPKGSLPPENDVTVEEIMGFINENIARFHSGAPRDIRVEEAVAMSGLCEMKRRKVTDENGVSWTEIVANPDKPLKKGTKGIWSLKLAQYMHGARIMESYSPYGCYMSPGNPNDWYLPIFLYAYYLDEKNRCIGITALKEVQLLDESAGLLPYEELVKCLETRMKEGKLKSIYELRLGYSVRIVTGDAFWAEDGITFSLDTRFVLVPEWQILGFDEKDAATAKSVGYDEPGKDAILDPANHSRYGIAYELRMDASTGEFILDYEAMEYDLKK